MSARKAGGRAHCIAIIPARGGSKGIPGKNLRIVGGLPLVAHSVLAARASKSVAQVYVSTDDPKIAEAAKRYGAEAIMRPQAISGDSAASEDALLHGLELLRHKGVRPDILVFLQCTSPMTTPEAVDRVVAALDEPRYAMAFSVAEDHGFIWKLDAAGVGCGVNHDASLPRVRRQDLPPQYRETGAIYVMRVPQFIEKGNRFCGPAKPVPLSLPIVEIDTPEDLEIIQILMSKASQKEQKHLPPPAGIKVLVTDFDGVHTDDCVYVDENGKESVRCSRSDGMGIEMLQKAGIEVLILSKESNPVVAARAKKLGVGVIQACDDKKTALENWIQHNGLTPEEVAYMGNDINDLACMQFVGWSCCPQDAHPFVLARASFVVPRFGGQGAVRSVSEMLISARESGFSCVTLP